LELHVVALQNIKYEVKMQNMVQTQTNSFEMLKVNYKELS